jgi:hypothetical protein
MKILRIHSGFTTNSSSASEWVPPEGVGPNGEDLSEPLEGFEASTQTPTPQPGFFGTHNPVFNLGLAGFGVVLLFVIEEIVRRVLKRAKRKKNDISHL